MKTERALIMAPQLQLHLTSTHRVHLDEEQLRRQVVEILARILVSALGTASPVEVLDEAP
jgi:hypothetical protein